MLRLGVTGGLGSGKSVVSQYFVSMGATLFDADVEAKSILLNSTEVRDEVATAFGSGVVGAEGSIDPAALGAKVFANEADQQRLNAIIHPRVIAAAQDQIAQVPGRAAEMGSQENFDDLGTATAMADWTSMMHESQYSRLFRS